MKQNFHVKYYINVKMWRKISSYNFKFKKIIEKDYILGNVATFFNDTRLFIAKPTDGTVA